MTISKEKLQQHITQFPEEISIDEVIERLIMIEKIESRIEESDNDETIDEAELRIEMQKWFE